MPTATPTKRTRRTRPLRGARPVAKKAQSSRSTATARAASNGKTNGNGSGRRRVTAIERDHADRLHDLPEEFLRCRDLRHAMEPLGAFRVGMEVHRRVVCTRCGTEREDIWRIDTGARERANYRHSKGYLVEGLGKIEAIEVRREVLGRVKIYETQEDMLQAVFRQKPGRKRTTNGRR